MKDVCLPMGNTAQKTVFVSSFHFCIISLFLLGGLVAESHRKNIEAQINTY